MTAPVPHDVVVVGAGFAGVGMAIALREAGIEDVVVLERAEGLGGTWRDNHYPGCACDVPAPLYSFSFAPNPGWTSMYAPHDEIRDYIERCVDRHGVRPQFRFGVEMTRADWDDEAALWTIETAGGETLRTHVLVPALGGLSRPSFPAIEGLDGFAGEVMHSAQWDHDVDLVGKRVAVIGTGASAIQIVPSVARIASSLSVFQRTAPWVVPKPSRRFSALERKLFARVPLVQKLLRAGIWAAHEVVAVGTTVEPAVLRIGEAMGRANIRRWISDPELRAAVAPDYRLGCKRTLVSNSYYRALAKDHVSLVTEAIDCVSPAGVVTSDAVEHAFDVVILATGFRATDLMTPLEIHGIGGVDINEVWADGMQAHLGTTLSGFPNCFTLVGPNTGTGHTSQIYMIEAQIGYVLDALATMHREGIAAVDVRPAAQASSVARIDRRMERTVWTRGGCNSWYLDATGRNVTLWPGFSFEFRHALRRFDRESYELRPATKPSRRHERPAAAAPA